MPHSAALGLFLCGDCPILTSRSEPFSRKMAPKVWKSSDFVQQGLREQQHNAPTVQQRLALLRQPPGQGKELQARANTNMRRPALQWEGEGRGHRPHLVELSPSMADSISSSQSSSKRPLGDALLELEPPAALSQGPPMPGPPNQVHLC